MTRRFSRIAAGCLVAAAAFLLLPPGPGTSAARAARTAADPGYDDQIQDSQKRLEALKRRAEQKRKKARIFAKKEQGILQRLNRADQALAAARRYLRGLDQRQADLEREIARTESELSTARGLLQRRKKALARQLRHSYMYGKARSLEVVFASSSFADLLQRGAFLKRVLRQDKRLVLEVEEREAGIQDKLARLRRRRDELERVRAEKIREKKQVEQLKAERARSLAKVRNQRRANEQAAKELEAAAARMKRVLAELERKRREAMRRHSPVLDELDHNDFGKNRGRLPWPVQGKVIAAFGPQVHPKYKTVTRNNGIDIAAALGTPVRSVGDGVVDMVQWLPGYGQTVIVNHGRGFYSIYAHLSSVAVQVGTRVAPGQTLGAVGDTGSLHGACLHFEVRKGGTAEDPTVWLR